MEIFKNGLSLLLLALIMAVFIFPASSVPRNVVDKTGEDVWIYSVKGGDGKFVRRTFVLLPRKVN